MYGSRKLSYLATTFRKGKVSRVCALLLGSAANRTHLSSGSQMEATRTILILPADL